MTKAVALLILLALVDSGGLWLLLAPAPGPDSRWIVFAYQDTQAECEARRKQARLPRALVCLPLRWVGVEGVRFQTPAERRFYLGP